jgi:hypothetical protein
MLYQKKKAAKFVFATAACLVITGCHLFDDAHRALAYFCPGLHISLNGVNESFNRDSELARQNYVLRYTDGDEKNVEIYFFNNNNGYAPVKNSDFSGINSDENQFIADDDKTVGKSFKAHGDSAVVVFDQSRHEIIIMEYLKNHKKEKAPR